MLCHEHKWVKIWYFFQAVFGFQHSDWLGKCLSPKELSWAVYLKLHPLKCHVIQRSEMERKSDMPECRI